MRILCKVQYTQMDLRKVKTLYTLLNKTRCGIYGRRQEF